MTAKTTTIGDIALVCRSKNAGMALLTIDVQLGSIEEYAAAKDVLQAATVADLYGVNEAEVSIIYWEDARTVKLTFPRRPWSGSLGDRDVYGCQQHAPILNLELGPGIIRNCASQ